jgi:hypothetical protein
VTIWLEQSSDLVVDIYERRIELRRSAVIGNDLDAKPAIAVLVRSTDRIFKAWCRDRVNYCLDVHAHEPIRALTNGPGAHLTRKETS